MSANVLDRQAVSQEETWNAQSVFEAPSEWDDLYERIVQDLKLSSSFEGTLDRGAEQLLRWFNFKNSLLRDLRKLTTYATMAYSTNSLDKEAATRFDRLRTLTAQISEALSFELPELIDIGFEHLYSWMKSDPDLIVYKHYFETLERSAKHSRSAEVEALLGAVSSPFVNATASHGVLANTDLPFEAAKDAKGQCHEITQSTIRQLLGSADRILRQSAYENYADAHLTF